MDQLNALHILGLEPGCSQQEIRDAYRALTLEHHPEDDPAGFARIQEAYRTLTRRSQPEFRPTEREEEEEVSEDAFFDRIGADADRRAQQAYAAFREEEMLKNILVYQEKLPDPQTLSDLLKHRSLNDAQYQVLRNKVKEADFYRNYKDQKGYQELREYLDDKVGVKPLSQKGTILLTVLYALAAVFGRWRDPSAAPFIVISLFTALFLHITLRRNVVIDLTRLIMSFVMLIPSLAFLIADDEASMVFGFLMGCVTLLAAVVFSILILIKAVQRNRRN